MKNMAMVILVGILSLGLSFSALAAMNHQPHSDKTFMGKERQAKTVDSQTDKDQAVVSQTDKDQAGTRAGRTHIKHYQKTPHQIRR